MALKFSQGLLSSLGSYGQGGGVGIPTDPRQRNLFQQVGVTNPLLQALGQSLGVATQNLEAGKGRVDFGSAQDKAIRAYKEGRDGDADTREARAAQLEALGYTEQADKLRAVTAQQRQESGAMQQLIAAEKAGRITQEERDSLLRGIGERTVDPSAGLRLVQGRRDEERGIENRRKEREQLEQKEIDKAMALYEKYKERGAFENMPDLEADIKSGAYTTQAISQMGIKGIEEGKQRTKLLAFAENQGANDVVKAMVQDGTIATIPQIMQLSKPDGMSAVPEKVLQWYAENMDDEVASGLMDLVPETGIVSNDHIYKMMNYISKVEDDKAASLKGSKDKNVPDISKQEFKQLENTWSVLSEDSAFSSAVKRVQQSRFPDDKMRLNNENRKFLLTEARQKYPSLSNEDAIRRYINDLDVGVGQQTQRQTVSVPAGTADGTYDIDGVKVTVVGGVGYVN